MKFVFIPFLFLFMSCVENHDNKILASVYDNDLLKSDVYNDIPDNIIDTTFYINKYVKNWIRKQLLLHNAEINLNNDIYNFEKQIEEYRSSLMIYAYQKELVNQNFDTILDQYEILDYYNLNKEKLILNKNIFKGRFVKIESDAPDKNELNSFFFSKKDDYFQNLLEYCQQFASEYYLDDSIWQYFDKINVMLPEEIDDFSIFKKNNGKLILEDIDYKYYLFIREYKLKGDIIPFELEREKIRIRMLNRNKLRYLERIENELYNNALNTNKIKIY